MTRRFLLLSYTSLSLALASCSHADLAPQPTRLNTAATTVDYAASTTSPQPSAADFTYEATPLVVRESAGFTGPGPFVIENRNFAAKTPEGWLADIYLPNGQQVILRHCTFAQDGGGDFIHITDNSRVRVENCRFYGTGAQPLGTTRGRALYAYKPAQLVFEHNYLRNTAGTKIEYWADNVAPSASALRWRYNRVENICGGTGGDYRQALQLQHVEELAGIEVAYNQIINLPNQSRVEDNFNLGESSGTSGSPLHLHHNYVQGAYPAVATASGFTGSGITTDAGGVDRTLRQLPHNIVVEDNFWVACKNACMNIAAGYDILYQRNVCRVSGQLADGTSVGGVTNGVSIFKGQPYSDAQFHNNRMVANDVNTVPSAYFRNADVGPNSTTLVAGNTFNTYATDCSYSQEQAAFSAWQQALAAAQVPVGVE